MLQVQEFSPIFAGLALFPPILLITFLSGPAGKLTDRIGPRLQMIGGPLAVAAGMALIAIPGTDVNYFIHFLPGLILFGGGMAFVIAPLTKSALSVDEKYSGIASGVNNAVSRVAALMSIAILGAIIISSFSVKLTENVGNLPLQADKKIQILEQSDKLAGIEIPEEFDGDETNYAKTAVKESFIYGFRIAIWLSALLALISAGISWYMIRNPS